LLVIKVKLVKVKTSMSNVKQILSAIFYLIVTGYLYVKVT